MYSLDIEKLATWLYENNCPLTSMELYYEWSEVHHERYSPLLEFAESSINKNKSEESIIKGAGSLYSSNTNTTSHDKIIEQAVVNMLVEYGKQEGESALTSVVTKALEHFKNKEKLLKEDNYSIVDVAGSNNNNNNNNTVSYINNDDSPLNDVHNDNDISANKSNNTIILSYQSKLQQMEGDLNKITSLLSERLPLLIRLVDPLRKDALIPLINLVATQSLNKFSKNSARIMLLTLYNRPNREHRLVIAEAWVGTLKNIPLNILEQEIVPELYNLANAKVTERRILALDCLACVAILLKENMKLRQSISQGLLWPLCEDESRTVRYHVVRCLVELWPKAINNNNNNNNDEVVEQNSSSEDFNECLSYYMELILHLILHDTSNTVRRRAFQSLRTHIFPNCLSKYLLLKKIIPLLLSFLERESAVINTGNSSIRGSFVTVTPNINNSISNPPPLSSFSSANLNITGGGTEVTKKQDALEAVSARNTLALINLIEDALLYAQNDNNIEERKIISHSVFDAYLHVVLPSAKTFILVSPEQENLDTSICAVASALATIIPALSMPQWKHIRLWFENIISEVFSIEFHNSNNSNNSTVDNDVRHIGVPRGVGWPHRQLCFFFAFLTCVAGKKESTPRDNSSITNIDIASDAANLLCDTLAKDEEPPCRTSSSYYSASSSYSTEERLVLTTNNNNNNNNKSIRLEACAAALSSLASTSSISETPQYKNAAAVASILWSLTECKEEPQRRRAVILIERVSGFPKDDHIRSLYLWPPLLILMNDAAYKVQEAAVLAAITMITFVSSPAAQEKVLKTALATVEAAGCPSQLSIALLQHWCGIMQAIPAEPREYFMYPQLATMINQLSEAARKVRGKVGITTTITMNSLKSGQSIQNNNSSLIENGEIEEALQAILAVLAAIPHSAVVTPQLVKKYLMPSMQVLSSLPLLSATRRSQLLNIVKEYNTLLESSSGLHNTTTGLFGRFRDEFKKRF